jgi:F0F1-type ATP synthase assembly protein I
MAKRMMNKGKFDLKDYAKYSSLIFQMAIIIAIGVGGGYLLDHLVHWKFPVFIILFSFISVVAAIYFVVKDL